MTWQKARAELMDLAIEYTNCSADKVEIRRADFLRNKMTSEVTRTIQHEFDKWVVASQPRNQKLAKQARETGTAPKFDGKTAGKREYQKKIFKKAMQLFDRKLVLESQKKRANKEARKISLRRSNAPSVATSPRFSKASLDASTTLPSAKKLKIAAQGTKSNKISKSLAVERKRGKKLQQERIALEEDLEEVSDSRNQERQRSTALKLDNSRLRDIISKSEKDVESSIEFNQYLEQESSNIQKELETIDKQQHNHKALIDNQRQANASLILQASQLRNQLQVLGDAHSQAIESLSVQAGLLREEQQKRMTAQLQFDNLKVYPIATTVGDDSSETISADTHEVYPLVTNVAAINSIGDFPANISFVGADIAGVRKDDH